MNNEFIYSVRSLEEIEALKAAWLKDPCWDIEDTEGFEAWHTELLLFRLDIQRDSKAFEAQRIGAKTAALGINATLLQHIEALELRIVQLERQIGLLL